MASKDSTDKTFQSTWGGQPDGNQTQEQHNGDQTWGGQADGDQMQEQHNGDHMQGGPDKPFQSIWGGQADGDQMQGQSYGSSGGRGTPQGYQSRLAMNISEFFGKYWEKQCPLREGYEGIKGIFKAFDDENKRLFGLFRSPNKYFREDIEHTINATRMFFDLKNPYFLTNFHLLIYTTLRLEP